MTRVARTLTPCELRGMEFLNKIERLLKARGEIQADLARGSKIAESQFSRWKKKVDEGKTIRPTLMHGVKIARELGVTAEYLADDAMTDPSEGMLTADERRIIDDYRTFDSPDYRAVVRAIADIASKEKNAAARRAAAGGDLPIQYDPPPASPSRPGKRSKNS